MRWNTRTASSYLWSRISMVPSSIKVDVCTPGDHTQEMSSTGYERAAQALGWLSLFFFSFHPNFNTQAFLLCGFGFRKKLHNGSLRETNKDHNLGKICSSLISSDDDSNKLTPLSSMKLGQHYGVVSVFGVFAVDYCSVRHSFTPF